MTKDTRASAQRIVLSKTALEAIPLPEKGKRLTIYDLKVPKLACRITSSGTRTFYVVTRTADGMEWLQLGTLTDTTVEQARKHAAKVLGQFAEGRNPAQVRREAKAEMTLGQAFEAYMTDHVEAHGVRSASDMRQMWERCLGDLPDLPKKKHARTRTKHPQGVNWQNRKLRQVSSDEMKKVHLAIGKSTPIVANRVLELVSAIFNHVGQPNPTIGVRPFKEQKRDRFLQESELPKLFEALAADPNADFRDFVTLSLITGARRGNVLAMRWPDVDFDRAVWRIPGEEFKNGEPMHVPLVGEAISILVTRKAKGKGSPFVFPADSQEGYMTPPKKRWARLLARAGLEDLRLHDLRRSLGSWQAILGASLPIVGRSLGHKSPSATAIYARLSMDPVRASVEAATSRMLSASRQEPSEQPVSEASE